MSFVGKINKNLGSKYSQKLRDDAKKAAADAFKTASKRLIKKNTTEVTGDLIGKKITDKVANSCHIKIGKGSKTIKSEKN